jgi:hypothetical protein
MKYIVFLSLAAAMLCVMACPGPNDPGSGQQAAAGAIVGRVFYRGGAGHGGIAVALEQTDGLRAASVNGSAGRHSLARSVASSTVTADDGSYRFDGIAPGTYTVYAMSRNTREKAVAVNVVVPPGQTASAGELALTPIGEFTGKIDVTGDAGNAGVLVFAASTSYMAMTDYAGNFTISDVPMSEEGYLIVAMKGNHTAVWGTYAVSAGATTDLGTLSLELAASGNVGIQWKGSFGSAPENPEVNWAYYDTAQRKSFIWDGTAWRMIAQDGTGASVVWKGALSSAPEYPETNWAYYDIARKASFIWDGGSWQMLSQDGSSAESGIPVFFRVSDMSAWLINRKGGDSPDDPVAVVYAGYESAAAFFGALDAAKKFVDIDISLSRINRLASGDEAGRKYIVSLALPYGFSAEAGTEGSPAFKNFDSLASVTGMSASLSAYAFAGLASLRSVKVIDSVSLGTGTFMGCISLSEVDMPLAYVNQKAFNGCISLASITIQPSGETGQSIVFEEAFSGCTGLVSVYMPNASSVRSRAFKDCTGLVSLYMDDPPTFEEDVFSGAARTARTITLYVSPSNIGYYQDLHQYGANSGAGYFWDTGSPYRDNLIVALGVIP